MRLTLLLLSTFCDLFLTLVAAKGHSAGGSNKTIRNLVSYSRSRKDEQEDDDQTTVIVWTCIGGVVALCILCCIYQLYKDAQMHKKEEEEEEERQVREMEEFEEQLQRYVDERDQQNALGFTVQGADGASTNFPASRARNGESSTTGQPVEVGHAFEMTVINADQSVMSIGSQRENDGQGDVSATKLTKQTQRSQMKPSMRENIMNDFNELEDIADDQLSQQQKEDRDLSQKMEDKPQTKAATAPPQRRIPYSGPPYTAEELYECRDPILVGERGDFDPFEGMGPEEKAIAMERRKIQIAELVKQMEEMEDQTESEDSENETKLSWKKKNKKIKKNTKVKLYAA